MQDCLAAIDRLPFGSVEDLVGPGAVAVLAPHPDDETLGCGGLIAASVERDHPVTVIVVTDGTGSHPNSAAYPPSRLAAMRRDEVRGAVEVLGLSPDRLTFLGLEDTAVPLHGDVFETAADQVAAVVRQIGATALFTTWGHDPHCDHEASARIARAVLARQPELRGWAYPIWGLHRPPSDRIETPEPVGFRLDIAPWLEKKHAALACHVSQTTGLIDDDPGGFCLSDRDLAPFLGPVERFLEMRA